MSTFMLMITVIAVTAVTSRGARWVTVWVTPIFLGQGEK